MDSKYASSSNSGTYAREIYLSMWKKSDERAECRGGGIGGLQQRKKRPESFDRFIPISLTLYIKSHPKMIAARSETMKNIFIFFEQGAFLKVKVGLLH